MSLLAPAGHSSPSPRRRTGASRLRQGVIEISDADMTLIAEAMFTAAAAEPHRLAA